MTMLVFISVVCLLYALAFVHLVQMGRIWINPITYVFVYYFFNYPIRAGLIHLYPDTFNTHGFNGRDLLYGLTYSTAYVAIFFGVYVALLKVFRLSFRCPELRHCRLDMPLYFVSSVVVCFAGAAVIGFEVLEGRAFSLGQDIEDLRRPFWINAVGVFYSLKWFALCLGVLVWIRTRSPAAALGTLLVLVTIVAEGVLSTGKGFIVSLLMAFFFIDNLLTGRTIRPSVLLVGGVVLVLFSSYSYYVRYYVGFGRDPGEMVDEILRYFTFSDIYDNVLVQLESIVNRGTYYLDGLMLMIRDGMAVSPGAYWLGSAVELLNIIPRGAGLVPEQYSFDLHVTEAVWRSWSFSQVFVGRIGESFFVLGYFGLAYAPIHAIVFALVARSWMIGSHSLAGIALYFAALTSWLHQDASLFYQVKTLLYMLLAYFLIRVLSHLGDAGLRSQHRLQSH